MSDFLSNLIARSQGTLPVIQPRLPSLYEPYRPHSGSLAMPTDTEPGVVEDVAPAASVPLPQAPEAEPPAPPTPGQMRAAPLPPLNPVESAEHRESRRPLEAPSRARHFVAPIGETIAEVAHRSVNGISRSEISLAGMIPSVAQAVNREPIMPAGPFQSNGESQSLRVPDAANLNRGDPQQPLPIPSHAVAVPLPPPRPQVPHTPFAQARPDTEERVVHVTIGRVDVRAILPTPSLSSTTAAKFRPHLSLDEYLKQRDREQR
jgi:hypothetical protein